ncbi:MAG: glycosyltransferase family 4 protein, partial [Dehalococcoidia bacterium]
KGKVLLISGCYFGQVVGGTEYQQYLIGKTLKNLGYKVYYLFIDNGDSIENAYNFNLVPIKKRKVTRKIFGKYFFLDIFEVESHLRKINPDLIIARSGFAYVGIAAHYAQKNSCKMIWHIASENDVKPFQFEWNRSILFDYINQKFFEYGIRKADYIIGQAKYQNELLKEEYGRECDLLIPNFHPEPKHQIREENPIKVLWVSNFKPLKQPEIFIKLAGEFKDYENVRFIMVGRPGQKGWQAKLENKIDRLNNLEYLGEKPVNGVNKILCESHIFVNTSKYEGLPNTFVQAWMREVPVVSLNVDPDDILVSEGIGFHSGNLETMIKDVKNLISDSGLREEMGE